MHPRAINAACIQLLPPHIPPHITANPVKEHALLRQNECLVSSDKVVVVRLLALSEAAEQA